MDTPTTAIALRADLSLAQSMLCDDISEIFEDTSTGPVVALLDEYRVERAKAERIAALLQGPDRSVVRYFVDGSEPSGHVSAARMFDLQPALAVMNAYFWERCIDATDIGQAMPEARAKEWRESIEKRNTPDFTPDIVLPTKANVVVLDDGTSHDLSRGSWAARGDSEAARALAQRLEAGAHVVEVRLTTYFQPLVDHIATRLGSDGAKRLEVFVPSGLTQGWVTVLKYEPTAQPLPTHDDPNAGWPFVASEG